MARVSRKSMLRRENGATYYVRSRTIEEDSVFEDQEVREWAYQHILWLANIYFVTLRSISLVDDCYELVLSVRKPKMDIKSIRRRFEEIQKQNRAPLKWYDWRAEQWHRKLSDLSEFMKRVNQSVARYVQRERNQEGAIWRDRFQARYLANDHEILAHMALVQMGCVRRSLAALPSEYACCSNGRLCLQGRGLSGFVLPRKQIFQFLGQGDDRYEMFAAFTDRLVQAGYATRSAGFLADRFKRIEPESYLGMDAN